MDPNPDEIALKVSNLSVSYGLIPALRSLDLTLQAGELVAVIGPNGAGKSTLLRAISGVAKASGGSISIFGQRIEKLKPWSIAQLGVAHVPQGRRCFGAMSVEENLVIGAYRLPSSSYAQPLDEIYELFPALKQKRRQMASELSGGQQQMLAIGRGLMSRPKILLLDEPSLGLSPLLVQGMTQTIRKLSQATSLAIILCEQNSNLALRVSSRAYVLQNGRCVLSGKSDEISTKVKAAYLGE